MVRLWRAEDVYTPNGELAPMAEWAYHQYPPVFVDRAQPDRSKRGQLSDATIKAYVNHGRWVADCPFCPSAQVVSPADPRFLCAGSDGCANSKVQGSFAQVVFPADLELIEQALLLRPDRKNRNWTTESVAVLLEENTLMLEVA